MIKYSGALIVTTSRETSVAPPILTVTQFPPSGFPLVREPEFLNGRPQLLGDHTGVGDVSIGKDNGQFVAAISGSDITGTRIPNYGGSNHPQAAIACLMSVPIIEFLPTMVAATTRKQLSPA